MTEQKEYTMKNWVRLYLAAVAVMVFGIVLAGKSFAAQETENAVPTITLTIKDHKFEPASIEAAANQKLKLVVENKDATPEEFESHDLHREKIIPGNSTATINVGPLKPGTYKFFGEFNEATAQGTLVIK
jgi:plastocyanin domain-containing protein